MHIQWGFFKLESVQVQLTLSQFVGTLSCGVSFFGGRNLYFVCNEDKNLELVLSSCLPILESSVSPAQETDLVLRTLVMV